MEPDLTIKHHRDVFVIDDLASVQQDGKPVPGIAPAAKQMGGYVARLIRGRMANENRSVRESDVANASAANQKQTPEPKAFHYADYGNLAKIGRMAAVVDLRGFGFSGVSAWLFWLAAHVFFLIGFRNRIAVLLNWGLSYFTYQRGARIMLDSKNETRS